MNAERIRAAIDRHQVTFAVSGALTLAILLTLVSMALYISSGASRLDLSRPGYEKARSELTGVSGVTEFSATGPLNSAALKDFQTRYDAQRKSLNALGDFSSDALSDDELQLSPRAERTQ